jgi:hypothetical protein
VVVRAGDDGRVDRMRIGWRARCDNGGRYSSRTIFLAPLDSSTAVDFRDTGDYRARPDGYTARIHVAVSGWWSAPGDRWHGRFSVRVRVVKDGSVVDTCRLRRLRWSAGPA